jgi:hypothetical protein
MGLNGLGSAKGAAGTTFLASDAIAIAETAQNARPLVDTYGLEIND